MNNIRHDHDLHEWTFLWAGCPTALIIYIRMYIRADSRFAPSQWEKALLCYDVSNWLGANLESALYIPKNIPETLQWRHNDHDSVSNHQPHGCLLNRLFRCRSKKTSKLRVTGLCVGNSPEPVNSPHKGPVTRKMFPFDDLIMNAQCFNPPHTVGIQNEV